MILYLLFVFTPEIQAHRLIENQQVYPNRADALLVDDSPAVREALKRQAVARGLMYSYQATLFDDGFGPACRALGYLRAARERQRNADIPDYPITRGKP